jgi:DNA gyrase/topoisomerase IV subunit B
VTLHGKLPNALDGDEIFTKEKEFKHADLKNIVGALGLDIGVHYNNTNFLRYGHLMLMMDQVSLVE